MGFPGHTFSPHVNCILHISELLIRCEISCLFTDKDLVDEDEAIDEAVDTPVAAGNDYKKGSSKKRPAKKGEALVLTECD